MNAETKGEACLLLSCSQVYEPLHMNTKTSLSFQMKLRTASVSSGVSNVAVGCLYGQAFPQLIALSLVLAYWGYVTVDSSESRCSLIVLSLVLAYWGYVTVDSSESRCSLTVLSLVLAHWGYVTVDSSESRCSFGFRFRINSGIFYHKVTEMPRNSDCKRMS
jgi:hypothetical protein